jgi:hypothetical protein
MREIQRIKELQKKSQARRDDNPNDFKGFDVNSAKNNITKRRSMDQAGSRQGIIECQEESSAKRNRVRKRTRVRSAAGDWRWRKDSREKRGKEAWGYRGVLVGWDKVACCGWSVGIRLCVAVVC